MADRFPLIVNSISKKIEELVSGDNLELTGNGIVISGDTGAGKYLTSDGTNVFWGDPGNVYLTQTQTLTNKTLELCIISGSNNTLTNIPNSALINSGITVNGVTIPLGGTVTTPDNNTTYSISAQDGLAASEKIIRLLSGGNANAGVIDDILISVASPVTVPAGHNALSLFLDRVDDNISISGYVLDNNTITTLSAPGGTAQSGAIDFTSTGAATVSMTGSTINIDAIDTDTKTKIRVGTSGSYGPADNTTGNFTFLDSGATTITQGVNGGTSDPEITVSSTDSVTRIRGGSTGTYTPQITGTSTTDISIEGGSGGNVTVSQTGNTIYIDSLDTNTVTQIGSDNNGNPISPQAGNFRFKQSGDTTVTQTTNSSTGEIEITISSINTDTGASLNAGNNGGLILQGTNFNLKNYQNFSDNTLVKWDNGNSQLTDSIISDDGSTVTIGGDLVVEGNQTILNTSVLQVEDNIIELRKGNNIVGFNGGVQINRTTDSNGNVTSYNTIQWYESGAYWRSWDGSVENRFVTEDENQVLTNKRLTSPILDNPTLGAATATSINGLSITSTASATLGVASSKTINVDNDLTLRSDNNTSNITVNFRLGGDVAYKSDTLASFASTTSTQLRGLISDTTGLDRLVFQTSPNILTSITTTSSGFALLNSGAQSIQFGGAATQINIGASGGTTTFDQNVVINEDLTVGATVADTITFNGIVNSENADIRIRGGSTDPMIVGRGASSVASNTAMGVNALGGITGGSQNTGIGFETLLTTSSGAGNTGYGFQTLRATGVGNANTAVGRSAMLQNQSGDYNVAIGANSLETPTAGDANVCIGYYAGYNCGGSGNVLIGPADSSNPINDATYQPLDPSGNRQLVIGSGTEFWIRGDANYNLTLNNDVIVNRDLTIKGDLVVNGTTTSVNSNVVEIADKAIELAKVVSVQFTCSTTNGSANITAISPTLGLIPGMEIISNTGGVTVPGGTTILSISGNTATLSNNVTGTGTPTFSAIGPSNTAADGGGVILNGTTNKTFTWTNSTAAWTSSEHMDLASGKEYRINNVLIASSTQIGPSSGVFGLGAAVTTSSLTSVGTLTSLTVSGNVNFTSTGYLQLPSGTTAEQPGQSGQPAAAAGQLRYNTSNNVFEGYDGNVWGKIGGGAAVSSAAPSAANEGDLWYDTDDGRMFVYYNDGTSSQWVDASPNGVPTDLVVEGTLSVSGNATFDNNTLFVDATNNKVGIKNTTPISDFVVDGSIETVYGATGGIYASRFNGPTAEGGNDSWPSGTSKLIMTDWTGSTDVVRFYTPGSQSSSVKLELQASGAVLPGADATQDLGSASARWANIYSADLQLSNEGGANDVDGTWGQYTIQEGEEDLFLINRRNGKKYKFNLTEVA